MPNNSQSDTFGIPFPGHLNALYQRTPVMSPESRALVNMTLDQMKRLVRGAMPYSSAIERRGFSA